MAPLSRYRCRTWLSVWGVAPEVVSESPVTERPGRHTCSWVDAGGSERRGTEAQASHVMLGELHSDRNCQFKRVRGYHGWRKHNSQKVALLLITF